MTETPTTSRAARSQRSAGDGMAPFLSELVRTCRKIRGGRVADYIPQLASVDPDLLGIAVCSTAGAVETAGDAGITFTIQSVCKPFLYGAALARYGLRRVHSRVGVEPTGKEFNSYTRLESGTNRPANPMINAGAIAMVDLLMAGRADDSDAAATVLTPLSSFAGRGSMSYDNSVFESERNHATRNRVIANLMRHFDLITGDVETVLDCYFKACALNVTCRDLAIMAACLANGGVNPITGSHLLTDEVTSAVITLMATCGMYDASGVFAYEVGLPAKSGVSGGIVAVVPGRYGLAVYSPRVDAAGNSVRGRAALRRFAKEMGSHFLKVSPHRQRETSDSRLRSALAHAYRHAEQEAGGQRATYLPSVDPSVLAMAVCSVEGHEQALGAADHPFSLQAIANPLAFGFSLMNHGERVVRRVVGVEPSGNPFHAILIDRRNGRPYNPLGNAGAIALAGLNATAARDHWVDLLPDKFGALAAKEGPLPIDEDVLRAERAHGFRNRAIANLLLEVGALADVEEALSLYSWQCAFTVTCRELARIGCALANGGVQPFTGQRVLPEGAARSVLTVMYTCGMHDQSGRFAVDAGLPAKSGLCGGILAVVPGHMGIAVFSPPVDAAGTSVRGRTALREFSRELGLSIFASKRTPSSAPEEAGR